MPPPLRLLKWLVKAAAKNAGNLVGLGVAGDIVADVWESWEKDRREADLRAELQALAQAAADEVRQEVLRLLRQEAPALPEAQRQQAAAYLSQVPGALRRGL